MRTAVVRVDVDPAGALTGQQLAEGMATLVELAAGCNATVVETELGALVPSRRQVEVLIAGDDPDALRGTAIDMCRRAFGVLGATPAAGVLTYVSRGTDDDAHGVLAGMGLRGEVERRPTDDGWDVVTVTLRRADLTRVPESRVQTALEASLNCEVVIVTS